MPRRSPENLKQMVLDFDASPDYDEPSPPPREAVPVVSSTPLPTARVWFRQYLQEAGKSRNTIESYVYDLVVLEQRIGKKPVNRINETDIAGFLADASSKVTRKRRLTSVKAFWGWLIDDLKVLQISPAADFSPHPLDHKLPDTLAPHESEALMQAAIADEPWAAPAIWLMLHLGIGRNELLALERHQIDRTPRAGPEIDIRYADPGKRAKDRTLLSSPAFGDLYTAYLERKQPDGVLFPYGPQAVNGMVDRVRTAAGITRKVTPQILRHTAAVNLAAQGHSVNHMLAVLGLANDARNRETIRIYMAAAHALGLIVDEDDES